jgi:hypothetical protein
MVACHLLVSPGSQERPPLWPWEGACTCAGGGAVQRAGAWGAAVAAAHPPTVHEQRSAITNMMDLVAASWRRLLVVQLQGSTPDGLGTAAGGAHWCRPHRSQSVSNPTAPDVRV